MKKVGCIVAAASVALLMTFGMANAQTGTGTAVGKMQPSARAATSSAMRRGHLMRTHRLTRQRMMRQRMMQQRMMRRRAM